MSRASTCGSTLCHACSEMPSRQFVADRPGIAKGAVSRPIDIARRGGWTRAEVSTHSRGRNTLTTLRRKMLAQAKSLIKQSD